MAPGEEGVMGAQKNRKDGEKRLKGQLSRRPKVKR
jgi:hypothetical protein